MNQLDISVIVNAHHEGLLLWRSLKSAAQAIARLPKNVTAEVIVVLDAADQETVNVARQFRCEFDQLTLLTTVNKDLGLSRNSGARAAKGRFVAFLDGDDIWGPGWLAQAHAYALTDLGANAVMHPQALVHFDGESVWWQHTDSRDPSFDPSTFLITNHWTSSVFAARELFIANSYTSVGDGYGFEDWEWNLRTLSVGIHHAVVPETVHFVRRRQSSMMLKHVGESRVVRPNGFWRKRWQYNGKPVLPPQEPLGDWLLAEWKLAHEVEPELWPNQRELVARQRYAPPSANAAYEVYHRIAAVIPQDATHLILFAGVGGGADMRVEHYRRAVIEKGGTPICIATDGRSGKPWAREAAAALQLLSAGERGVVMQRLMLQFSGCIHIVNSRCAWEAFSRTNALAGKVFASLYAFEHLKEPPHLAGYAAEGQFSRGMDKLRAVITDNHKLPSDLANIFGWPSDRIAVAGTPIEPTPETPPRKTERLLRFLWAGAVNRNKNLELLYRIALHAVANHEPFLFDVIGDSQDFFGLDVLARISKLPNVTVKTTVYNGWSELHPERYDAFVFTSLHEGYPNVVLEALANGLPVVTTPAGGVGFEREGFPGAIIDSEDVLEWSLYLRNTALKGPVVRPRQWIKEKRSFAAFLASLASVDYFFSCPLSLPSAESLAPSETPEPSSNTSLTT